MTSTATRLAGIDASTTSTTVPPAHPAEPDSQTTHTVTPRPSRASLPLDRRPSRRSLASRGSHNDLANRDAARQRPPPPPGPQYSATSASLQNPQDLTSRGDPGEGDEDGLDGDEEDMDWGPAHPCFPHPNPHVPRDSEAYAATRVIRVQRDYLVAGDAYPQFQNVYPEIVGEWIGEDEFREMVEEVNRRCKEAFDPEGMRAKVDAVLGVLTGFIWEDVGATGVKKGVRSLEEWMESWNKAREEQRVDGRLVPLRTTGWLSLDIVIPDPGVDVEEEEVRDNSHGMGDR